ncbi:DUF4349 domain-containing protein [Kitasatospora sp. NPDC002040]|uniref:DUF4349 domain-containing protein n=1 Tax=Kitasatospora sp. NPDC002040 TaxID=3154661 RepID=UPI00332ACBD2
MTAGTGSGRGRAALAAAGVAVAVLLAGCSAEAGHSDAAARSAPKAEGAAAAAPAAGDTKPGAGGASAAPTAPIAPTGEASAVAVPRLIAYTAQLSLRTKEMAKTLGEAQSLALAAGGYVGGESTGGKGSDGVPTDARLTLKVPSASYQQTLDRLSGLGEVLSRSSQADDLTEQVADVASRVKTQQASVDRVRKLLAEAKSLSEVVSLESELTRREADLESLQHRQQELSSRTSLSTITLQVYGESAPVPTAPKAEEGFWGSIGHALGGGWNALVTLVRGLLIGVAAVAPFLLVLAPLGALAWWLRRRRAPKPQD